MCLPANATTNRGEHYWLVLGWHEILSCIWHKQSLLADICIVLWHSPFQYRITNCHISLTLLRFHCSRKKHFEFKGILLIRFIRNQEICLMSSQIVTLGPSVTSHLASDTGEDRGCPRHRPVSPDLAPSLPRLLSVSALRAERSDQSPSRHLGHNLRELGSLKAKSNHDLLDSIVILSVFIN